MYLGSKINLGPENNLDLENIFGPGNNLDQRKNLSQ